MRDLETIMEEFDEQAHGFQEAFYIGGGTDKAGGVAYWKGIEFAKSFLRQALHDYSLFLIEKGKPDFNDYMPWDVAAEVLGDYEENMRKLLSE